MQSIFLATSFLRKHSCWLVAFMLIYKVVFLTQRSSCKQHSVGLCALGCFSIRTSGDGWSLCSQCSLTAHNTPCEVRGYTIRPGTDCKQQIYSRVREIRELTCPSLAAGSVSFKSWWQGYHRPQQGRVGAEGVLDHSSKVRGPRFQNRPSPKQCGFG